MKKLLLILAAIFIGLPVALWLLKVVFGIVFGVLGFVFSHFWGLLIIGGIAYLAYANWDKVTNFWGEVTSGNDR
ncbi:MAG: hypothetical protein LBO09_02715 [Candidatus Peribacteria bacterium]|nr:hypothetical protein [Candidatus Peribacteria bacterium]